MTTSLRREHILVMETKLGRALLPGEEVHHKDEDKQNNAPDNLELKTSTMHGQLHIKQRQRDARGRLLPKRQQP
ncbi:MAG: hypothetical protein E6Q97_02430 [Desulfurellales bacterium]|nr:MAG: hypothetical protein E6Q97_02430 [Desulfurellales bacterium]